MTTIYEVIYASLAVVIAGFAVILFIKLDEEIKAHADTAHELTKTKLELQKEQKAHTLEIQTRCFRIEERKVQKLGAVINIRSSFFRSGLSKEKIEKIIRQELARQMSETIAPNIEIGSQPLMCSDGTFRFYGTLHISSKNPEPIDLSEVFRIVGRETIHKSSEGVKDD